MRTFRTIVHLFLAGFASAVLLAAPASASQNFGNCESSTTFHAANAPGQSGNGPSTQDANGVTHNAQAFAGNISCP
jgi:hypothetical protein